MAIGLVGRKCGMTRIFTEEGAVPVTVIEVLANRVTQIKTADTDKYFAVQVTTGTRKKSRLGKPSAGIYAKANTGAGRGLWEFAVEAEKALEGIAVGSELKLDRFAVGQYVDVTGITKGKGFAGTIKRHHFASQDASHGNSVSHRVPGSIGQRQTPGKVFKGKKMCGHLGQVQRTIQSQVIVRLDMEKNLVLVRGAIPGAPGSDVIIRPSIKRKAKKEGGK
ncbi:MAG TPA: 50S ribosomal protein L3 [Gammaproteobacteria bacterium]|nr:50S ribosomal protein L3 [Gammaproteobacteria bacterium]